MTSLASLPTPRAFLFDLDGTLVETVATRVEAWMEIFAEEGIPADPAFVGTLIGSDGKFVVHTVAAEAGQAVEHERAVDIDRRAGLRFGELNVDPRALRGVRRIVEYVDSMGLPWAVATSSLPQQVQVSIDALGLDRQPMLTDGGHVEHAKPAPDLLLHAAAQIDVEPADAWYIGDATWDMLAAVAAGMTAIGVTTGAASADDLRQAGAHAVFADLDELLAYLSEER